MYMSNAQKKNRSKQQLERLKINKLRISFKKYTCTIHINIH